MKVESETLWAAVRLGEDSGLELKEVRFRGAKVSAPRRDALADELAAFANAGGGRLVLGVRDDRTPQSLTPHELDALLDFVTGIFEDSINVLALYPNKTYLEARTDAFGHADFTLHSELPMTVLCAAPGFGAKVARDHGPHGALELRMAQLVGGGLLIIANRTGHLPGIKGRLNPILDTWIEPICTRTTSPSMMVCGSRCISPWTSRFG